jgi:hypothetical protein
MAFFKFIRQIEHLQYFARKNHRNPKGEPCHSTDQVFHTKTRIREEREAEEQLQGAGNRGFLVLRPLRFPLLATQLPGNAFDLLPLLRISA